MNEPILLIGSTKISKKIAYSLRELGFNGKISIISDGELSAHESSSISEALQNTSKQTCLFDQVDQSKWYELQESIITDSVIQIDRKHRLVHTASGQSYAYSLLVLSQAASAKSLNVSGAQSASVFNLRTAEQVKDFAKRLQSGQRIGIVGTGLLGLEVAAAARQNKCAVTILERAQSLDPSSVVAELAPMVVAAHQTEGVGFRFNAEVDHIAGKHLYLSDGERFTFDSILVCMGTHFRNELAVAAGLSVNQGIVVNRFLQTKDPHIFALGDGAELASPLTGQLQIQESCHNAEKQAQVVANNIVALLRQLPLTTYHETTLQSSKQYHYLMQICGEPQLATQQVRRALSDKSTIVYYLDEQNLILGTAVFGLAAELGAILGEAKTLVESKTTVRRAEELLFY